MYKRQEVDEATTHLNAAVEALAKADTKVTVTLNKKTATVYKGKDVYKRQIL